MIQKLSSFMLIIVIIMYATSCTKESDNAYLYEDESNSKRSLLENKLRKLSDQELKVKIKEWRQLLIDYGFEEENITAMSKAFLVEGDIVIEYIKLNGFEDKIKKSIKKNLKLRASECNRPPLDNCGHRKRQNIIFLRFDNSLPEPWRQATREAIDEWNRLPTNALIFRLTNGCANTEEITVKAARVTNTLGWDVGIFNSIFGTNPIAITSAIPNLIFNFVGLPDRIVINIRNSQYTEATAARKKETMMHELGHAVGLMHPKENTSISCVVHGTSDTYNSIMGPGFFGAYFRPDDIQGITRLYPKIELTENYCVKFHGNCGSFVGCSTCPPGFQYDGSNCYSGVHFPAGYTPFVWNNGFYTQPGEGLTCPPGFQYDGSNCHKYGLYFPDTYDAFVHNNAFYLYPKCVLN